MKKCWVIYDQFLKRVHKFVAHFYLNLKLEKKNWSQLWIVPFVWRNSVTCDAPLFVVRENGSP